ncbi:aldose epimerase family protein [Fibrella aquatilis]|uniref:Aldose 1-epimerase n=1 Tax=Fibrella aquatilis TaxID=2817059 RepID=A0A939G402_9BACT|nr:aldose epimerase family protein [Fibrella aquatilis]MBO0930209.1 galactose mutarotase [Fibrella aquatilis]
MQQLIYPALLLGLLGAAGCQSSTKKTDANMANTPAADAPSADSVASATNIDTTALTYKLPNPEAFETIIDGKKTTLYVLKGKGIDVAITNYGARLVGLIVPDKAGKPTDVVMGFGTIEAYKKAHEAFYGPVVGRVGNRIAKGTFVLNGKTYKTELNNNGNTLHGGPSGFHTRVWDAKQLNPHTLQLTYVAKDGEGGFPGTLTATVTYSIDESVAGQPGLKIDYKATTDKPTPVNPTSHAFFNLNGEGSGTVNNHILRIDADRYSAVDKGLIPQGEPVSVANTPFDFRKPTAIGARIDTKNEQLTFGKGYDHNWVLNHKMGTLGTVADVVGDKSGIKMTVLTTEPGLQFYGGNFFTANDRGKYGRAANFREGLALETQHYPDSPNHPSYPTTILKPGQTYTQTTVYRFGK